MTPSLKGSPTKAQEAPSPYEVTLALLDTNPVFQCLGEISMYLKNPVFQCRCFIEFLLYFNHFFIVCYYFLFNQRLLENCLEKSLCFRENTIFFFLQKMTKFSIFVTKLSFSCYKLFC